MLQEAIIWTYLVTVVVEIVEQLRAWIVFAARCRKLTDDQRSVQAIFFRSMLRERRRKKYSTYSNKINI
jgi:hypothetical protein